MKRLISVLLLVALVGSAVADIHPGRRPTRPVHNLPQEYLSQGLLGSLAPILVRFFAPSWWPVQPRYSAPRELDVPVPPVRDVSCLLRPVQAIGQ
jgi:hypothetical protein